MSSVNSEHVNVIIEHVNLPLAHINIAAKRYGDSTKPIILALHGWLDNLNSFNPLAKVFDDLGVFEQYQLIAIDLPGHGLSDHRPGKYPLHFNDYVYDLNSIVEHLKLVHPSITLLGHSMGGIISALYNSCFPENINKLILIEAIAPLFEASTNAKARLRKGVIQQQRINTPSDKSIAQYENLDVAVKARQQLTGLDRNWCELLTDRNMQQVNGLYQWRSDPRLKCDSLYRFTLEQVNALMDNSSTPCLLILGHDGYKQLADASKHMTSWFDQLEMVTLDGDHHLHMGNANAVAARVGAFILT